MAVKPQPQQPLQPQKNIFIWVLLALSIISLAQLYQSVQGLGNKITYTEFVKAIEADQIEKIAIRGENYTGKYKKDVNNGESFTFVGPFDPVKVLDLVEKKNIEIKFDESMTPPFWQQFLVSWLPVIGLVILFLFFMKQFQSGGGKIFSFGKARPRLLTENQKKVTFADVAGIQEAKEELLEIIDFLKAPKKFTALGGRIPKGVLLMGAPGTGKTLLARAIAGEAGVPFFSISGSDFVEMFVGVGASRVRDLFEQGKKHAPCIVFIDEIDAVGRHRGTGLGGGHDEREQTLNQLLVEMDGFESNEGVILIAATNRPDVLDPALLRPGRFDRRIIVPRPDLMGREAILRIHSKKVPLEPTVDLVSIARGTPGFCGADLENLVNEAALYAARKNRKTVIMSDFEMAKDKILMGSERRSMLISDEEKKITAYHEAGHTLVAKKIPGADPVHKVTIIPRGMALGVTQQLPEIDKYTQSKSYTEGQVAILMGGRIAEELIFNQQTTGAGNDIEKATEIARRMVCEWGMSEKMGPLSFGKKDDQPFLGRDMARHQDYSESTAVMIDKEVKEIVMHGYGRAKTILTENIENLHQVANALLEHEVLDGDEIDRVMRGEKLPPMIKEEVVVPDSKTSTPKPRVVKPVVVEEPEPEPLVSPIPQPGL